MKSKVSKKFSTEQRPAVKPKAEDPYYVPGLPHPLNGVYPRVLIEKTLPLRN